MVCNLVVVLAFGGIEGSAGEFFWMSSDLVLVLLRSVILVDLTLYTFTRTFFCELASNCLFIELNKSDSDFEALLRMQLLHEPGPGEHFASGVGVSLPGRELAFSLYRFGEFRYALPFSSEQASLPLLSCRGTTLLGMFVFLQFE